MGGVVDRSPANARASPCRFGRVLGKPGNVCAGDEGPLATPVSTTE